MASKDIDIRDPLYGFIEFPSSISPILSTLPLIRLTRIKQLAHTYLVYPSAVHTRFEHSIGTYHIAGLMAHKLDFKKEEVENIQLAALLHDIGHGPYSHPFEDVMRYITGDENFSHKRVGEIVIENESSLKKVLSNERRKRVLEIYNEQSLASDIISGSLDADKLDYLRRDAYHTGVSYGIFDYERIIRTLTKNR
ncbi:MAG: HD domain-containing protein [Brevinematia bacterium]